MPVTSVASSTSDISGQWSLPPLILHPFAGDDTPEKLLDGSKASLILNGLLPDTGKDREKLNELVLRGRVQELRMLYFLGRDLLRWVEQCVDFVQRTPALKNKGLRAQSFAALLVETPPKSIADKLQVWGVTDQRSVFSRAIGITSVLTEPPVTNTLTPLFLVGYHRFLDYMYVCFQNLDPFTPVPDDAFSVEMYASAEYTQMLTDQWEKDN